MRFPVALVVIAAVGLLACGTKEDAQSGDTSNTCDVVAPGAAVPYSAVDPIVQICAACHNDSSPAAGLRLDTFEKVSAAASFSNDEIQAGRMPPSGGLPTCDRELFQAWLDGGKQP